jgi:hypothetical protein
MKMLPFEEFFMETAGGNSSPLKHMNIYENHPFKYSCGKEHQFEVYRVRIIRRLPKMYFVFQCPDDPHYLTYIHIKGLLWFKGFDSLFGTKIEEGTYGNVMSGDIDFLYENAKQVFDTSLALVDIRRKREQ